MVWKPGSMREANATATRRDQPIVLERQEHAIVVSALALVGFGYLLEAHFAATVAVWRHRGDPRLAGHRGGKEASAWSAVAP